MTLTQRQRIEALFAEAGLQFDGDLENWPLPILERIVAERRVVPSAGEACKPEAWRLVDKATNEHHYFSKAPDLGVFGPPAYEITPLYSTPVSATASSVTHDEAVRRAHYAHAGVWPAQLESGVMFYLGQRITRDEFTNLSRPADSRGVK